MSLGLPQRVTDSRANRHELIENAVAAIGRSKDRRLVFEAVYYHKQRIKTVDEIAVRTGLKRMRVLQEANFLASRHIIGKVQRRGEGLAYEQDEFYQSIKAEILRRLDRGAMLEDLPTKRTPHTKLDVKLTRARTTARARFVTLDEIDSFSRVRAVKPNVDGKAVSEAAFKAGLQRIIGETGTFTDWGGEQNDLFTTWLRINGKRRRAAFALKGPGAKGKMTLRHLGKNADQILRLFQSAADVFLVQYHGEIDQMVTAEMETHARDLARKTERAVWFGIIDGQDSRRLMAAYSKAFGI